MSNTHQYISRSGSLWGLHAVNPLTSSLLHSLPILFECLLDDLIVEFLPPPTTIGRSLSAADGDSRASLFDVLAPPPFPFATALSPAVFTTVGCARLYPPSSCDRESFVGCCACCFPEERLF